MGEDRTETASEIVVYGSGPEQFGEFRHPAGSDDRPLVVLIHGGFWRDQYRLDLMVPLAESLSEAGFASWNIEYRRVGPSGGGFPTTLDDVAAALDHVDVLGGGSWRALAVVGHSAGGHLALWNASRVEATRRPDLTVALAGVTNVVEANRNGVGEDATRNFFGGDVDDVPKRYDAGQPRPQDFAGRVVLIHGTADENVPLDQSERIADSVAALHVLHDVDHMAMIDPAAQAWALTLAELRAL